MKLTVFNKLKTLIKNKNIVSYNKDWKYSDYNIILNKIRQIFNKNIFFPKLKYK